MPGNEWQCSRSEMKTEVTKKTQIEGTLPTKNPGIQTKYRGKHCQQNIRDGRKNLGCWRYDKKNDG